MKQLVCIALVGMLLSACGANPSSSTNSGSTVKQSDVSAPAEAPPAENPAAEPAAIWIPTPELTWDWQLSSGANLNAEVQVFDIDLFGNSAETVAAIHAKGAKAICYISVGTLEDWQADAATFPQSVIGKPYDGWPGEYWLDIRQIDLLAPVMRARLDMCRDKGFDGFEPDNIDGFYADTGFPLTAEDELRYVRWLANEAHQRGLSMGLKNVPDFAAELVDELDWALTEDCLADGWCDQMKPFIDANKAVFMAEYTDRGTTVQQMCPAAKALRFSPVLKNRDLGIERQGCEGQARYLPLIRS